MAAALGKHKHTGWDLIAKDPGLYVRLPKIK